MPPKTSTPPKAGLERSTFFFKYIKCIQFLPKSNWIAICANSQWKARLQRWKKTTRRRGEKSPKILNGGDRAMLSWSTSSAPQTQPKANRQTYQAATIDSSLLCRLYESALLSTKSFYFFESTIDSSPLYSLKPAALFYLYTWAIESNNSFFYFVVLHST